MMKKHFILLDIETTGLNSDFDEITEIGAVKVDFLTLEVIAKYESLVKTKSSISKWITYLTGINDELLAKKGREISEVLKELVLFSEDLPIYAHFAQFDKSFIRKNLKKINIKYIETMWIDTIKIFKKLIPGFTKYKLEFLINKIGIKYKKRHRALDDAKTTLEVLKIAKGKKYIPWWSIKYKLEMILNKIKTIEYKNIDARKSLSNKMPTFPITFILNNIKFLSYNFKNNVNIYNDHFNLIDQNFSHKKKFISNSLIGTSFDQMIEYYHNKDDYFKKMGTDYKIDKFIFKKLNRKKISEKGFLLIALSIIKYRSGNSSYQAHIENILENRLVNYKNILNDIYEAMKLAKIEAKKIKKSKVIFNPLFTSSKTGIKADGDLIINNYLCEIKLSNSMNIKRSYIHQLISYILLNEYDVDKYKIRKDFIIYWNPMYNHFKKYKIVINSTIKLEFKKMLLFYEMFLLKKDWRKILNFYLLENENEIDSKFVESQFEKYFKISTKPKEIENRVKTFREIKNIIGYFNGKRVAIIGRTKLNRSFLEKKVNKLGGTVMKSIGITTNIVICGQNWERFKDRIDFWFIEKIKESKFILELNKNI